MTIVDHDISLKQIPKEYHDSKLQEDAWQEHSQIYIQIVFAVQGRQNLLHKAWWDEVFKYMTGIIKNKG